MAQQVVTFPRTALMPEFSGDSLILGLDGVKKLLITLEKRVLIK